MRTKITALLLSLVALWGFAAWVTLREGLDLLSLNTLDTNTGRPGSDMITALQEERRATMVFLGRPGAQQRSALTAQRQRTDVIVGRFRRLADSEDTKGAASDIGWKRIKETLTALDGLATGRRVIDTGASRGQASATFNGIIDSTFRIFRSSAGLDDEAIAKDSRTLIDLTRAREMLAREDALLSGVLAAGRFSGSESVEFTELVGTQRFLFDEAVAELPASEQAAYEKFRAGRESERLRLLEDRIIQRSRASAKPPLTAEDWRSAVQPVLAAHERLVLNGGDAVVERATPVATGVIIRLVLAGGLGLLAVIASVIVSITTARALVRQLERLRAAAWELAEQRLPSVVDRLGHGEKVDVALEAPPLQFGTDEIGQVGRAFNAVQETAIRTAVEQAELRRGIRDVLLSLARRTQALVHRQLNMLDTMERKRDIDPKDLEELFRLDHLATRMRRNAENLIVLSGSIPARGWRQSVPMVDVVRAAVGEVEDYTRVTVLPFGPVELAGRAVGDLTHLLAELIENAVAFSPPDTAVHIGGHLVANGFAIDIEDRGLGMTDDKLAEINERIVDPPEFNLRSSVQLGLFVVAKLAERYGVQVSLKRSAYGGTTAVVVIPQDLVVESGTEKTPGATTENGLAVRQPAPVSVSKGGEAGETQAGTRGVVTLTREQPAPPALVAVPPPATGPDGAESSADVPEPAEPEPAGEPAPPDASEAGATAEPEISHPEDQPAVPESSTTPSGLPVRVPQANLAAPLQAGETPAAEQDEHDDPGRSPEEIQRIMGSYQRGTRLARTAVEARTNDAVEGEDEQ
ncbi:nitrate- and nitrite sensing domain-containing protein [Actinomadura madurae]|uniref:sensor histidine kinase n=1 Tax=Actinomadura madurae TaxID=1993 RepID=UPI001FD4C72D|nr:nitrate- and nitrite sensing domain-containing protein [Actinomadura madurae]